MTLTDDEIFAIKQSLRIIEDERRAILKIIDPARKTLWLTHYTGADKIKAIKAFREITGAGLKEMKEGIEAAESKQPTKWEYVRDTPERRELVDKHAVLGLVMEWR